MRKLAILTFVTLDGLMEAIKLPDEDTSNDFKDKTKNTDQHLISAVILIIEDNIPIIIVINM